MGYLCLLLRGLFFSKTTDMQKVNSRDVTSTFPYPTLWDVFLP